MKKNKNYFWIDPDKTQQLIEARDSQYAVGFIPHFPSKALISLS